MKAKITVEICECYDRLSVLEIKLHKTSDIDKQNSLFSQIEELKSDIQSAIGYKLSNEIYSSQEYRNLYQVNQKIFALIDELKLQGAVNAHGKWIDNTNYKRFIQKKILQETFFGKTTEEIKLGYEN